MRPLLIPSNNTEMQKFLEKNKDKIYLHIVKVINNALEKNEESVEIFKFQKSNYCVVVYRNDYYLNLENAFQHFLASEKYEECESILKIKEKLENFQKNIKFNILKNI